MRSALLHSYRAGTTALKQYNTNTSRHVHHKPTNQTKTSPVMLSLETCSNLHQPLPAFSRTHPVTHSAGLSMAHLYHSSLHSFIYPQQPTGLWMARPNMTMTLFELLGCLVCFSVFQCRPVETWQMSFMFSWFLCKALFCDSVQRQWLGQLLSETSSITHAHKCGQKQGRVRSPQTISDDSMPIW